jgi:phosphoglycerate kinase
LAGKFDKLLIGGTLGTLIVLTNNMELGKLREDGLDIDQETIGKFVTETGQAGVVVVAGPMGKFELQDAQEGTRQVFGAAANSKAYKVAGGGNTEEALAEFGLTQKFDWISVGGGAMLQFLARGTLPGIQALLDG